MEYLLRKVFRTRSVQMLVSKSRILSFQNKLLRSTVTLYFPNLPTLKLNNTGDSIAWRSKGYDFEYEYIINHICRRKYDYVALDNGWRFKGLGDINEEKLSICILLYTGTQIRNQLFTRLYTKY